MSKLSSGASYISKDSSPAKRFTAPKKSPLMVIFAAFFAVVAILMSLQPIITDSLSKDSNSSGHAADAKTLAFACWSDMGQGMDTRSDWHGMLKVYPQPDASNRTWTLQEAFVKGIGFVNYEGEGGADKAWVFEKPENTHKPGNYDAVAQKLEGVRTVSSCELAGTMNIAATLILSSASGISNLIQTFVVFAFDANIICEDPANPGPACLNILKVVGGTSGDSGDGLIGVLTSSVYLPLLVMAVALTGLWVAYKGLVQRKIRESLFGALWVCLSVIFGLILLLNPLLLAKAPMAVSNVVSACVIGAFNGDNCMTGNSTGSSIDPNTGSTSVNVCRSDANVSPDEQMSLIVNSLSCSIWKAFILEPLAQGSFGTSFASLDTQADGPTKKVIEKAGLNPEDFCVYLHTSGSLNSYKGSAVEFDGSGGAKVCNLLAYQMSLQTNTHIAGQAPLPSAEDIDPRWYKVIVATAHDAGLWNQWAPSFTGSLHRIGISGLALLTTVIGGVVLVVTSFFALVYYLSSVILMAFAPLFFLIGVHPGKGKKILLGWLEKVISNVLKYLTSAVFLIVAVAFYGSILGNASNMGVTLLFVLIVTGALFMYRSELLDLIGKANMGGSQMSNALSDRIKKSAGGVASLGLAAAGAGVGSKLAGGSIGAGMQDGVKRELQRGAGRKILGDTGGELLSNAARQYSRASVDNAQDLKTLAGQAATDTHDKNEALEDVSGRYEDAEKELEDFDEELPKVEAALADIEGLHIKNTQIEDEVARDFSAIDNNFAQAQLLTTMLAGLHADARVAQLLGDTESEAKIEREINSVEAQRTGLLQKVDGEKLSTLRGDYEDAVEARKYVEGVAEFTSADLNDEINLRVKNARAQETRDSLVDNVNDLGSRKNDAEIAHVIAETKSKALGELDLKREAGQNISKDKVADEIDKAAAVSKKAVKSRDPFVARDYESVDSVITRSRYNRDEEQPDDRREDNDNRRDNNNDDNRRNNDDDRRREDERREDERRREEERRRNNNDDRRDNNNNNDDRRENNNNNDDRRREEDRRRYEDDRRENRENNNNNNDDRRRDEEERRRQNDENRRRQNEGDRQNNRNDREESPRTNTNVPPIPNNPPSSPEPQRQAAPPEPTRPPAPTPQPPPLPTQPSGRRAASTPPEPTSTPTVPAQPTQPPASAQPAPEAPAPPNRQPRIPRQPNQPPQGPSIPPASGNGPRRGGGSGLPTNRPDNS